MPTESPFDFDYILLQENGQNSVAIHAHSTMENARAGQNSCAEAGYLTSPVVAVPLSLSQHPAFFDVLAQILDARMNMAYGSAIEQGGTL